MKVITSNGDIVTIPMSAYRNVQISFNCGCIYATITNIETDETFVIYAEHNQLFIPTHSLLN